MLGAGVVSCEVTSAGSDGQEAASPASFAPELPSSEPSWLLVPIESAISIAAASPKQNRVVPSSVGASSDSPELCPVCFEEFEEEDSRASLSTVEKDGKDGRHNGEEMTAAWCDDSSQPVGRQLKPMEHLGVCLHTVCRACLVECARLRQPCPLCRSPLHACTRFDASCIVCVALVGGIGGDDGDIVEDNNRDGRGHNGSQFAVSSDGSAAAASSDTHASPSHRWVSPSEPLRSQAPPIREWCDPTNWLVPALIGVAFFMCAASLTGGVFRHSEFYLHDILLCISALSLVMLSSVSFAAARTYCCNGSGLRPAAVRPTTMSLPTTAAWTESNTPRAPHVVVLDLAPAELPT